MGQDTMTTAPLDVRRAEGLALAFGLAFVLDELDEGRGLTVVGPDGMRRDHAGPVSRRWSPYGAPDAPPTAVEMARELVDGDAGRVVVVRPRGGDREPVRAVVIGHGGWRIPYAGGGSLSGYGRWDWCGELVRGAAVAGPGRTVTVVDLTTCDDDRLGTFAIRGPMLDASLPGGTVSRGFREHVAWTGDMSTFGNAGGFDRVALDVFSVLARAAGATVHTLDASGTHRTAPVYAPFPGVWRPTAELDARLAAERAAGELDARPTVPTGREVLDELAADGVDVDGWELDGLDDLAHCHPVEPDAPRCSCGATNPLRAAGLI